MPAPDPSTPTTCAYVMGEDGLTRWSDVHAEAWIGFLGSIKASHLYEGKRAHQGKRAATGPEMMQWSRQQAVNFGTRIISDFTIDKRFHLVPAAGLLITIPVTDDRLVLRRIDLSEKK